MGRRKFAASAYAEQSTTEASRYGNNRVGAHVRSWDVGVDVYAYTDTDGKMRFGIWTTGGSNDSERKVWIATVLEDGSIDR